MHDVGMHTVHSHDQVRWHCTCFTCRTDLAQAGYKLYQQTAGMLPLLPIASASCDFIHRHTYHDTDTMLDHTNFKSSTQELVARTTAVYFTLDTVMTYWHLIVAKDTLVATIYQLGPPLLMLLIPHHATVLCGRLQQG
jgi:hypothetical protein